jgi:hypothetical protein
MKARARRMQGAGSWTSRRVILLRSSAAAALGILLAGWAGLAPAQSAGQRDPTVPPASALNAPALGTAKASTAPDLGPVAVIVRDGHPYLVVGTRLYAQGQSLGDSVIERITETEVWLRHGKTVHTKPIFGGIVRTASGSVPAKITCPPVAGKAPAAPRRGASAAAARSVGNVEPCRP